VRRLAPLLLAGLLVACAGDDGRSGHDPAPGTETRPVETALFALRTDGRRSEVVRLDRRSLRVLPGGHRIGRHDLPWTRSPAGDAVAFGSGRAPGVVLVGLQPLRRLGIVRVPGPLAALAWLTPGRLVAVVRSRCCPARLRALAIDVRTRRIVASRPLGVDGLVAAARVPRRLVLLQGPEGRLGATRLVVLDGDAGVRATRLGGIRAGSRRLPQVDGVPVVEYRVPSLAVDGAGRRAYVVAGPPALVAEVDLRTLRVGYHRLERRRSRLARFRDWLEPPAAAGGGTVAVGAVRHAVWLGAGRLAYSGQDEGYARRRGQAEQSFEPQGLQIVSTADWTVRAVEERTTELRRSGPLVAAWGWNGPALTAYDATGRARFRLVSAPGAADVQFAWPYAYRGLGDGPRPRRVDVVDLRTGAVSRARMRDWLTLLGDDERLCWC
jgi:hypothetical protein